MRDYYGINYFVRKKKKKRTEYKCFYNYKLKIFVAKKYLYELCTFVMLLRAIN